VNRDLDGPQLEDPEPGVKELGPVPHHDRDAVARGDSQVSEARGDVAGALGELSIGHGVVVEDGQHPIAVALRVLVGKCR